MRLIRIDSINTPCFMIFFFNCHYTFPILELTCREAMTSASQPFHQRAPAERPPCLPSLAPGKAATQREPMLPPYPQLDKTKTTSFPTDDIILIYIAN